MATTYLDLTNEVLRELNEIPLTSANFATAIGLQKFVKDAINKSIFDIANQEPQLPFFSAGVSGSTDPFYGNTTVETLADWRRYYRDSENADDANSTHAEPAFVIKSPDSRKFGLSPIPDKVYNVHFYAFTKPTALDAHGDTMTLPEQYSNVVTARTRYYVWQFKESPQQAAFALDDYKKAMRYMKSNLMNPSPKYMTDDRTYF
jgi:hypothetical protein